jgi:pyruvate/2-oxoglutarate dehydrogenase complex dihydrolipoamide acyltransferase (E2) component
MRIEIRIPDPGGAVEIEVAQVFVTPGTKVNQNDRVLEIATDKANVEIVAPQGGIIIEVLVAFGDVIDVDTILAVLEIDEE